MPNIRLKLEYNGANFCGWQKQPYVRTIQEELEKALCLFLKLKKINIIASGRTDSGVHADAQVVNFKIDTENIDLYTLKHSISSILKGEVSVIEALIVPDSFNSRRDANSKTYRYQILNRAAPAVNNKGFVWHFPKEIDVEKLKKIAADLVGTYDFTSFRASNCQSRVPIREIKSIKIEKINDLILVRVTGSGFLKQMVRVIIGTLIEIEQGRLKYSIKELLELKDRTKAGKTAVPYGLFLEEVFY